MDLREQLLRHRKDTRFIFIGLTALLAACAVVFYMLQRGRGVPAELAANKLLLFTLWYANLILILAILLILVRSFFRLVLERQNRILGSKFKTKLVLTAISLSMIPVLILFPFATKLLLDSFDQWFSLPIKEVVEQAQETAEYLTEEIQRNNQQAARRVLEQVISYDPSALDQQVDLQRRLIQLRDELQVHYLAVFDDLEYIHGTADLTVGFRREPDFRGRTDFLKEAIREGVAWRIPEESLDVDGRLMLSACAAPRPVDPDIELPEGPVRPRHTVVITGTVLPRDMARKSRILVEAHQAYLQMTVQRQDLRAIFLSILLMVTLLVMLAFSSIGMRLARRITAPIQALADGTRRISQGDLDHQVQVAVDDELGVLVDGFNSMTRELKRNRELVEHQHRELVSSNRRQQAVFQNVAAGVLAIDPDSVVLSCNDAASAILGQRTDDLVGRPIREVWQDPERKRLADLLSEEFTAGGQMRRQMQLTIGGVWKTLEVKITMLPDPSGLPAGGRVLVLEDLTELIQAQKMATWNEVARRIAHEIKNPLTPIQLTAERLLRKHQQGDPKLGELLELGVATIVREVESLKTMVDEFSRFARMPQPRPKKLSVETLFGELVRLHQGLKPGVEIHSEVGPGAETVHFDPEQLRSVLINLIDNAITATDSGSITLSSQSNGRKLTLQVADTGSGIPVEDRERIFLPYFSTKGRGTGLGLSIVHRIVADHHSQIYVTDNQPHGTIFRLEVPIL